jgi:hypothetical protein
LRQRFLNAQRCRMLTVNHATAMRQSRRFLSASGGLLQRGELDGFLVLAEQCKRSHVAMVYLTGLREFRRERECEAVEQSTDAASRGARETCHQLATLFSAARRGCDSADRTRQVRRRQRARSLALPQVCWTDGGRREVHRCRDATSFSAGGHRCRMKQLSTARKPCVLRHDPSLFALSPNKFLLPPSSHTLFATFFRNSPLPSASCHLLCSAAQSRRTATPALRSIQFP